MFPSEMMLLKTIDEAGGITERPDRTMDIVGKSSRYVYNSLVRRGYLGKSTSAGYELTVKGKRAMRQGLKQWR